jgi:hypothetical protein
MCNPLVRHTWAGARKPGREGRQNGTRWYLKLSGSEGSSHASFEADDSEQKARLREVMGRDDVSNRESSLAGFGGSGTVTAAGYLEMASFKHAPFCIARADVPLRSAMPVPVDNAALRR